jgi:hypothetical protein
MQDALHLFHIVRGPLETLARDWMCRGLRRSALGDHAGLDRYCPSGATTTNDGRAIVIGNG